MTIKRDWHVLRVFYVVKYVGFSNNYISVIALHTQIVIIDHPTGANNE